MRAERRRARLGLLLVALIGAGACTEIENAMATTKVLNFMRESPAFDPYEAPRRAPENAVPLRSPNEKWEPRVEANEQALRAWGDTLTNPLAMTELVLERGAVVYQTNCAVCHGQGGLGDGPVVGQGKLPFATNLLIETSQARSDGYIYAIIRVGRGLMPSYQRIPPRDRWTVVNYVRYLQEGNDPIPVQLHGGVQPLADRFNTTSAAGAEGADMNAAEQE